MKAILEVCCLRPNGAGGTDRPGDCDEMAMGTALSSLPVDALDISRARSPLLKAMRDDAVLPFPAILFQKWLEVTTAVAAGQVDWFVKFDLEDACHVLRVRSASWSFPFVHNET